MRRLVHMGDSGLVQDPGRNDRNRSHGAVLTALLVIAVLATLSLASSLLIPVVLAVLLTFLLRPVLRWLRLPEPVGAAILAVLVVMVLVVVFQSLLAPAMGWMERVPTSLQRLQGMANDLEEPVAKVTEATETVQELAEVGDGEGVAIPVRLRDSHLSEQLFTRTGSALLTIVTMVLLLYFLLAYGEFMVINIARGLRRRRRIRLLAVMSHLEQDFSTYLFTITIINACLGICQSLAMLALGMPDPWLWGTLGFLLNYIPYIGAIVGTTLVTLAAISTWQEWAAILLPPIVFYAFSAFEGYLVTPTILGRRFRLNPLVVLLGLLFWGWLWGIAGALLAVPILVALKVVGERVTAMRPMIYAMSGPPRGPDGHYHTRPPDLRRLQRNLLTRRHVS
ncbi:MAG: AI-2E family transporter [Planctomycetota bacterium]